MFCYCQWKRGFVRIGFISSLSRRNFGCPCCWQWASSCLCSGHSTQGFHYHLAGVHSHGWNVLFLKPWHTHMTSLEVLCLAFFLPVRCGLCFLNGQVGRCVCIRGGHENPLYYFSSSQRASTTVMKGHKAFSNTLGACLLQRDGYRQHSVITPKHGHALLPFQNCYQHAPWRTAENHLRGMPGQLPCSCKLPPSARDNMPTILTGALLMERTSIVVLIFIIFTWVASVSGLPLGSE